MHYISSSSQGPVSGGGPYRAMPLKSYFDRAMLKLHSEMGMPNIPPIESLKLMMPEAAMWPQGDVWGIHDFSLSGAQRRGRIPQPHRHGLRRRRQCRGLGHARPIREL